ncbi:diguanylate cyclase domain-containing protein [Noviherbaspirillum denitrificans]|uniref:Diguanylate cyclase n=1 Tax=Noviherbaspirillum denitrificans TaxID=1968433 RepID=A0A254TB82_9BURK|nr:diguanylate cyclase [Noviherbaspirillum denitrificans]OWW19916.1 diguanylate cyclase [Noviherbaspirillum denitrificans]
MMNRQLPNIVDLLLDAVFLVDKEGRIVHVSAACEHILGYKPEEMTGRMMMDFVAPVDRAKTRAEAGTVIAGEQRVGFENRYIRKDGRLVHLMWSARWSEADQLRIGVARDVTERRRAEDMQAATYAISEAAHSATDLPDLLREIHFTIARLVPAAGFAVALHGCKAGEPALPYQCGLSGGDSEVVRELCDETLRTGVAAERPATDHGSEEWIAIPLLSQSGSSGALILKGYRETRYSEKDKELLQFVSTQVATTLERRRLNEELTRAARYDDLTGLPNRRLFQDRLHSAMARARRHGERIALLYIDIDGFKQINDSLGHGAGDVLLAEIGLRLQQSVREEDTVARLGGDEFVVLLEGVQVPGDALLVAEKISAAISHPVLLDGHMLCVKASIGLALYPDHGESQDRLLSHADREMYQVKKARSAGL